MQRKIGPRVLTGRGTNRYDHDQQRSRVRNLRRACLLPARADPGVDHRRRSQGWRRAQAAMAKGDTNVGDLCVELGRHTPDAPPLRRLSSEPTALSSRRTISGTVGLTNRQLSADRRVCAVVSRWAFHLRRGQIGNRPVDRLTQRLCTRELPHRHRIARGKRLFQAFIE